MSDKPKELHRWKLGPDTWAEVMVSGPLTRATVRKTGNGVAPQTGPAARLQDSPLAEAAGPDSFGGQDFADPATGEVPFGPEGT